MKKLFWFFILFISSFYLEAQHQVEGYISVQWVSGYTYQITMEEYTLGDPQNSGFCGPGYDLDTIRLWFGDNTSSVLTRSNGAGDSVCTCRKLNTYHTAHTYPGPGTYRLWFDVQNRTINTCNILNSVNTDMYVYNTLNIPPAGSFGLPLITNPPACNYACPSNCYYYNPNVSVPAGDSVAYAMGQCLTMYGVAQGYYNPGAVINAVTGEFSWCKPDSDCLWSFAILITTYNSLRIPIDTQEVDMEVNVQSNCALGVNEAKGDPDSDGEQVNVYPNPGSGIFTFQAKSEEVKGKSVMEVYNMLGQQVYSQAIVKSSSFIVDLSSQPNGVYLYRVVAGNGSLMGEGKLVIQK